MNKLILKTGYITTAMMVIFGSLLFGNIAHEMTHYYDVKIQGGKVTNVCFLTLPLGYRDEFSFKNDAIAYVDYTGEDIKSSELKAGIFGIIITLIIFIFCAIYLSKRDIERCENGTAN